ncbi:MAG: stage III sporulation protein AA [Clostridiales bacterium]|nr:MAG: stage III sporulation protein AA [Clostridiales bacterium]
MREILQIMPSRLKNSIQNCKGQISDIRLKRGCPLLVTVNSAREFLSPSGAFTEPENAIYVYDEDVDNVFSAACEHSVYTYEDEIRNGFITMRGGHRVGLAGTCVLKSGTISSLKDISSLNIRVCREVIGCSQKIIPEILYGRSVKNTMIISPPGYGKTTILRDITRNLSLKKINVCVIDERAEICAMNNGISPYSLGYCVDVLSCFPKSEGVLRALRTLAPEVIIMDEISSSAEMESIKTALNSGISFIVTAHAKNIEDLDKRGIYHDFVEKFISLSGIGEVGKVLNNENRSNYSNMDDVLFHRIL